MAYIGRFADEKQRVSTMDLYRDLDNIRAGKKPKTALISLLDTIAEDYVVTKRVQRERRGETRIFLVQSASESHTNDL
jgi:hypothetical protein